jgi:hypothetical protein
LVADKTRTKAMIFNDMISWKLKMNNAVCKGLKNFKSRVLYPREMKALIAVVNPASSMH